MRISGLTSFPLRPLVPPPPRLPSPLLDPSSSYTCIAIWFLLVLATVAIDTPASSSPLTTQETRSAHVVAQFPSVGEQRQGLFPVHPNATRENSLTFNHLTIDPSTGRLYAGAVNRLLQLDSDLKLEEFVSTGKFKFVLSNCSLEIFREFSLLLEYLFLTVLKPLRGKKTSHILELNLQLKPNMT